MASIKAKITKRLIDSLKPVPDDDLWVWDTELRRYALRMKPSGAASYLILYRPAGRPQRMNTFARVGTITPEEARAKARRLLAEVDEGGDPAQRRADEGMAITVADVCEKYLEAARAGLVVTNRRKPKSPSTLAVDEGRIARHIIPLIGKHIANMLASRADIVQRMYDDIAAGKTAATIKTKSRGVARITGGPPAAKRAVGLLGGIWTWAAKRNLVAGTNPARGVEMQADETKERVLSPRELAKLAEELAKTAEQAPMASAAIKIIALTGLRADEACGLRWPEIDFAGSNLRLEKTKTGRSLRPIGHAAIEHLRALPQLHDEYVFPNRDGTGRADLKKSFASIFDSAGLHDARAQTLRRTFASFAADEGYGDATIGELLGHARRGVTSRHYIRRPDAALVAAADKVAERIAAAMDGRAVDTMKFPRAGVGDE
jgi:integrase